MICKNLGAVPSWIDPNFSGGCCVFQPKVQVKDNWGWCNGTCTGAPGGNGCYDKSWAGGDDECNINCPGGISCLSDINPWTPFVGKVIVAPE